MNVLTPQVCNDVLCSVLAILLQCMLAHMWHPVSSSGPLIGLRSTVSSLRLETDSTTVARWQHLCGVAVTF